MNLIPRTQSATRRPVDREAVIRVLQRGQGPHQPPRAARHDGGPAGMHVDPGRPYTQLRVQDALQAQRDDKAVALIQRPALPEAPVGGQQDPVRPHERRQAGAADLLLTIDDELDGERDLPVRPPVAGDGLHPRHHVAAVVSDPAREDLAVARVRRERAGVPLLQRLRRLDVAVVVHEQGRLAAPDAPADDRRAARLQHPDVLAAQTAQHVRRGRRALADANTLAGDARQPASGAQRRQVFRRVGVDVGREGAHS